MLRGLCGRGGAQAKLDNPERCDLEQHLRRGRRALQEAEPYDLHEQHEAVRVRGRQVAACHETRQVPELRQRSDCKMARTARAPLGANQAKLN